MKKSPFRRALAALTLAGLCTAALVGAQKSDPAAALLQSAIHKQIVDGDLKEAIKMYNEILSKYASNRDVAAEALLHMGEAQQKLGLAEARRSYERIVRQYSDQKELVREAGRRLSAYGNVISTEIAQSRVSSGRDAAADVSYDGRYILYRGFTCCDDLTVHDLENGTERPISIPEGKRVGGQPASFSKDGKQLVYALRPLRTSLPPVEFRVVNLEGSGKLQSRRLFTFDNPDQNPYIWDWSPDNKWLAASLLLADGTWRVGLISVDDGSIHHLKSVNWRDPADIFFSPDGKFLAYDLQQSDRTSKREIFILSLDGSTEKRVTNGQSDDRVVGWYGKNLVFTSDRTSSPRLWALSVVDGTPGQPALLQADVGRARTFGITRSGSIYFRPVRPGPERIALASLDLASEQVRSSPANLTGFGNQPSWSPDGRFLAYWSESPSVNGKVLAIRTVESGVTVFHPVAADYAAPEWSPDSRSLIFLQSSTGGGRTTISSIDVGTGRVSTVFQENTDESHFIDGVRWASDGKSIFLARVFRRGNEREYALGVRDLQTGTEREIIRRSTFFNEWSLSPDGRYIAVRSDDVIQLIPTEGGEPRDLTHGNYIEDWVPDSASLLIRRGGEVWHAALNGETHRFGGDGNRMIDRFPRSFRVARDGQIAFTDPNRDSAGEWREVWRVDNALLALDMPATTSQTKRENLHLTWFDRGGKPIVLPQWEKLERALVTSEADGLLSMSPDGKRIAVHRRDGEGGDIWIYDLAGGGPSRLTVRAAGTTDNTSPVWSPDGNRIVFTSKRNGKSGLYQKPANGTGNEELLVESTLSLEAMDWSRDGAFIVYSAWEGEGGQFWVLPLDTSSKPFPILQQQGTGSRKYWASLSPDGKWIAYSSNQNRGFDIFVASFPDGAVSTDISMGIGVRDASEAPRWRSDGRELYILTYPRRFYNRLIALPIRTNGTSPELGVPQTLLDFRYADAPGKFGPYVVVSRDGQRFLVPNTTPRP